MENIRNLYTQAGYICYGAAVLFALGVILLLSPLNIGLLLGAILFALVGYGLIHRGSRWVAYLAFIVVLIGIVISVNIATQNSGITRLIMFFAAGTNLISGVMLFGALWRTPPES